MRKKQHKGIHSRRGSAIILCLAILSLMLVLAMVFAFDARSSATAASNHSRIIRARLLNESGVNRALAIINNLLSSSNMDASRIYLSPGIQFSSGSGDWSGGRYMFSYSGSAVKSGLGSAMAFGMPTGDTGPIDFLPSSNNDLSGNFSWLIVRTKKDDNADGDGSSTSDKVIGRVAYVMIDNTGKLDPDQTSATTGTRTGASVSELGLGTPGLGLTGASTYQTGTDSWLYLADFYRGATAANSATYQADSYALMKYLSPGTIPDSEVFWMDANEDNQCDDAEIHDRFDLETLTAAALNAANSAQTAQDLYYFLINSDSTVTTATDSSKSPWLRYCGVPLPDPGIAGVSSHRTWRRAAAQLALNMMDYADTDETPRCAYVNKDGTITFQGIDLSSAPTATPAATVESVVYGVEKGLGIDELIVKTKGVNYTPGGAGVKTTVDMQTTFEIRLTNPMGNSTSGQVLIDYDLYVANEDSGADPSVVVPTITIPISTGGGNTFTGSAVSTQPITLNNSGGVMYRVKRIRINRMRIYSNNGSGNKLIRQYPVFRNGAISDAWFGRWDWSSAAGGTWWWIGNSSVWSTHLKATDPLFTDIDPSDMGASSYWSVVGGIGSLNANMTIANASLGAASPSYSSGTLPYSDVECKNNVFSRIGELGRVHHPHLQNYSLRFWIHNTAADGTWHDAYLLDMFRAGSKEAKISINGGSQAVYTAMFNGVGLDDASGADAAAGLLKSNGATGVAGKKPFIFRGDIYKIFNTAASGPGTALVNDKYKDSQAELAIQRVIEMFTTRQNYFTICVASQSLKDLGSSAPASLTGTIDYGGGKAFVESTSKTVTSVYRDAWKRKCKILRTEVIEDQ